MTDPLTSATATILWPYLRSEGFSIVTPRKFARERNHVFQQVWVDAGGIAGKKRTVVVLCASLPFGPISGYMDPHGFRISNGRSWNMANAEAASVSMRAVVEALSRAELQRLEAISTVEYLLSLLQNVPGRAWHATYSALHGRWLANESEVVGIVQANRKALKL